MGGSKVNATVLGGSRDGEVIPITCSPLRMIDAGHLNYVASETPVAPRTITDKIEMHYIQRDIDGRYWYVRESA